MNERLRKALLTQKKIKVEEIREFYGLNIEQMIELLLNYLTEKLDYIEKQEISEIPKYLFRILQKVDHLYNMILDDNKNRLPYYRMYQEAQEKIFGLSNMKKVIPDSDDTFVDDWYLNLYFYQNEDLVKQMITSKHFRKKIQQDKQIIYDFIQSYFDILKTDDYGEYQYWESLLSYLLLNIHNEHWQEETIFKLKHYVEKHLNDFPAKYKYRLNRLVHICLQVQYNILNTSEQYDIEFLCKKRIPDNLEIFTVDEEDTGIREDALSVYIENKNTHVTMYITDPTELFKINTQLREEAFSNWFVHQKDMVFEYEFSKQKFSLDENKMRCVIAYEMIFDEKNNLIHMSIYPTTISITKNYSYDSMKEKMRRKKNKGLDEKVRLLEIAKKLHESNYSKKRYHKVKELQYYLEYNKRYKPETKYMVVSEFKVLLGTILAKVFLEKNMPLIYRNNESQVTKSDIEQIEQTCNEEDGEVSIRHKITSLNLHSYYSYENVGHNGLGVKQYTHITTPLRNYFALINMLLLKELFIFEKKENIEKYMKLVKQLTEIQYEKQRYKEKVYQLRQVN